MRAVSVLWGLCRRLRDAMAGLLSLLLRLWRLLARWAALRLGLALPATGRGARDEPELSSDDELPPRSRREEEEEEEEEEEQPEGEGQPDTEEGAPAGPDPEPACETPGCEDEDEEVKEEEGDLDSEEYRVESTDEFYCGYDSTWDTEGPQEAPDWSGWRPTGSRHSNFRFRGFENAARDMQNYRHNYPSQMRPQRWRKPASNDQPNLNFYLGVKPSEPDGVYISDFHFEWIGDYDRLEYVHTFIQWLFPLPEPGMNDESSPLTKDEIEAFLRSSMAKENLLKSYKLMLDFYGIELLDEKTGKVTRATNWRDRFHNLNRNTHNNLRITRILKCQGILGYPHYQAPLVRFFLEETLVNGELPNVRDSVLNYFVFAVLDKRQRRSLIKYAYLNYDRKDEFVWCPKKIQMKWSRGSKPRWGMNEFESGV